MFGYSQMGHLNLKFTSLLFESTATLRAMSLACKSFEVMHSIAVSDAEVMHQFLLYVLVRTDNLHLSDKISVTLSCLHRKQKNADSAPSILVKAV